VPIGIIATVIALRAMPESDRVRRPLNYVGAALSAATFGLTLSGLQSLAHHEATSIALTQIGLGLLVGWALLQHERPRAAPIIPFDLLRVRLFTLSLVTSVICFTAQMSALVSLPFEIQRLGFSVVETGLFMTPWPLALAVAAPIAGRLSDRYPSGILGGIGLVLMASGLLLLAFFPEHGARAGFLWRMALCGLGFGFFQAPNNRTIMASAPRPRSGAAGGMLSTARLLGQTLGAAMVAILFRAYLESGAHVVLCIAAALALAGSAVSLVRLKGAPAGATDPGL
jgi:DHA2 family multidrug resistance protein-like MFS transporter